MWRFALLCSVVTVTVACTDGPGAPTMNTDGLSLQEGDPPPPPLEGGGFVSFANDARFGSSVASVGATEIGTQQDDGCVPPQFPFISITGDYFQNKSGNNARVHFRPVVGSGSGTIHETANKPDATASGTLVVIGTDGQQHQIHLRDYTGTSLFEFEPGDFLGTIGGFLDAEVKACGEVMSYTGEIFFGWCDDCGKF